MGGLIADRSDKRRLLLIVQTIAMAQSFVLAALAFSGHPPVLAIYAVALVGGVTIAFDNPARRSFVVEMVPADDMQNAGEPQQRADDVVASGRPGDRWLAHHHRRLWLVLPARRLLVPRRARRAVDDAY